MLNEKLCYPLIAVEHYPLTPIAIAKVATPFLPANPIYRMGQIKGETSRPISPFPTSLKC